MKVSIIEAKYSEGDWVYTKKQTYLPEIKDSCKLWLNTNVSGLFIITIPVCGAVLMLNYINI